MWEEDLGESGRNGFRGARAAWAAVAVLGLLFLACCVALYVTSATRASGGSSWPTVVKRFKAPRAQSFVSIWRPGETGRPVLEQFSLRDGTPLRTLLKLPPDSFGPERVEVTPAVGANGTMWFLVSSGPRRLQVRTKEGGGPVPDTCTTELLRFDASGERIVRVRSFPSSIRVTSAQPSPNGRWLLMGTEECGQASLSVDLLAMSLANGSSWTVGSEAPPCHFLRPAAWSPDASELVFPYGPATGAPTHILGEVGCPDPDPSSLAVVPAGHSSQISAGELIAPSPGCEYESAAFDREGIVAFEGCRKGGPGALTDNSSGEAYLVQFNRQHEVARRLALEPGPNNGFLASDPSTGVVLVRDDQAKANWVWEYNDGHLRLIKRFGSLINPLPW